MTTHDAHRVVVESRNRVGSSALPVSDLVVAGVDGSGCGRRAAEWAAGEAALRKGALRIVYAYSLPVAGYFGYNPFPANLLTSLREEDESGRGADGSRIAPHLSGRNYGVLS